MTGQTPEPRDRDRELADAADRLQADAHRVDTMAAMRRVTERGRPALARPLLLVGGLAVVILAVVGVFALVGDDDGETVITDGEQDDPGEPDGAAAHELEGTAWTLVRGDGPAGLVTPPDAWPITISFERDTFGGTASCNGYGGDFTLGPDGSIKFSQIGATAMGCEPVEVMEAEAAFFSALNAVDSYEIRGDTLALFGETAGLGFERQAPLPTAELVGQLWLLDTLIQGETATSVLGDPATLLLRPDGTLEGGTGCRTLTGTWIENGGQILFTSFAADGDCTPDLQGQDSLVVTVLGDGFVPSIDGTRLTLTSVGDEGLSYQAIDAAPEPGDRSSLAEQLTGTSWSFVEGEGPTGPIVSTNPISVEFFDGGIEGQAPCNTYWATTVFEGDQIEIFDLVTTEVACADLDAETEFYVGLLAISSVAVEGTEDDPTLILSGGNAELVFERVIGDGSPSTPITVTELLDLRPDGLVALAAQVVEYPDGTVLLCDEVRDSQPPQCAGRWVVVTNYNSLVDDSAASLSGVLREDGRFQIVGPGSGVEQRGSGVEITDADRRVLTRFLTGFFDGPTLIEQLPAEISPTGVTLWLGTTESKVLSLSEMREYANWGFETPDFAGFSGPFHIYDTLETGRPYELASVGPHDHCAGPPLQLPESLWGLRQLSIQPTGIDSCIQWFAVDLFVNEGGQIEAVMLDLFGP